MTSQSSWNTGYTSVSCLLCSCRRSCARDETGMVLSLTLRSFGGSQSFSVSSCGVHDWSSLHVLQTLANLAVFLLL
jgi:hypothetical protein